MKDSKRLKIQTHLAKEKERAEEWGVEINDAHLFNDHVSEFVQYKVWTVLLFVIIISIGLMTVYVQEFTESAKVARDLQSLKGFCDETTEGYIEKDNIRLDCDTSTVVITFTK